MEFNYDEKVKATRITISKEGDICAKCPEEIREYCPLLMALIDNIVYPCASTLEIVSCPLYKSIPEDLRGGVT